MNKATNQNGENTMEIANTIIAQLGNKALVMIGAKNILAEKNGVRFKIGRNSKSVNMIKITLNSMDTYDIKFLRTSMSKKTFEYKETIKAEDNGIYCDMLHNSIEQNTGLYTSL